ncbi:MAG: glycosyltransferase family 39 protein [Burkholderiaceae bacterium]|nr:glycosyltransferase family 39 protein [Burkholderiaceae bacterium]
MPKTALASSGSLLETQWTGTRALSTAIALIAGLILARFVTGFFWDVPLSIDEAQYTVWARELQAGYFSKPPVIAWAIAAGTGLCGTDTEACVRLLQPLALGGAALGVMATAWQLWQSRAIALWAGALFLSLPLVSFYSQVATTDGWFLLWWSWSLWALSFSLGLGLGRNKEGLEELGWVMVGLFAGLGLMTKYSMGIFLLTAILGLFIVRRLFLVGPILGMFVALLVISPNLFWNAEWNYPTLAHHAEISRVGQDTGIHLGSLVRFWLSQFVVMGPLVLVAFLLFSAQMFMRRALRLPWIRDNGLLFSLAAAWPFLAVISLQSLTGKVEANWAAPAAVGLSLMAARLWCCAPMAMFGRSAFHRLLTRTWLPTSLMLHLVFALVVLLMPWGIERLELAGNPGSDPRLKFQQLEDISQLVATEVRGVKESPPIVIASDDRHLLAMLDYKLGSKSMGLGNSNFQGVWYLPRALTDEQPARHHWSLQKDLRGLKGTWEVLYIYKETSGVVPELLNDSRPAPELEKSMATIRLVEEPNRRLRAAWVLLTNL